MSIWYDADLQIERTKAPFEKNGVLYPSSIFTLWSEQERLELGIYPLDIDEYPDSNTFEIIGSTYELINSRFAKHHLTREYTQEEKDLLYSQRKSLYLQKLAKAINTKLAASDWTQTSDIIDIKGRYWSSVWAHYRQELRNLMIEEEENTNTDINNIVYPDLPIIGETPISRFLISKLVVIDRLYEHNHFENAILALGGPGAYHYERWVAASYLYSDDPGLLALLGAIGADPEIILAPEGDTVDP